MTYCIIECRFNDRKELQTRHHEMYVGTLKELLQNISITWSKVPHTVKTVGFLTEVLHAETGTCLATFISTPIESWPQLPGHF